MQLIILGMHRAGTSMLARLLNMMGAYYGPEGIHLGASAENAKGFWERKDVLQLHNDILTATGSDWDRVGHFDLDKLSKQERKTFDGRIRYLLLDLDAHRPWMLKDPRLALMLPLWRKRLEVPVCIFIHRNPIQIAQSLNARNDFPIALGLALWEKYTLAALANSAGLPRVMIHHRNLFAEPANTIARLHEELTEIGVQGLRLPGEKEIKAFIAPELFHEKGEADLLSVYANVQQQQLCDLFDSGLALDVPVESLPPLSQGAEEALALHEVLLAQFEQARIQSEMVSDLNGELAKNHQDAEALHREAETLRLEIARQQEQLGVLIQAKTHAETSLIDVQQQLRQQHIDSENALTTLHSELHSQLEAQRDELQDKISQAGELDTQLVCAHHDLERVSGWLETVDGDTRAIFQSLTWKIGNLFANLVRIVLFQKAVPTAYDHIHETLDYYWLWKTGGRRSGKKKLSPSPQAVSAVPANLWHRAWQLANINNFKLFLVALKDLPHIGPRRFWGRLVNYLKTQEPPSGGDLHEVFSYFSNTPAPVSGDAGTPIDIVLPIYNGYDYLLALVPTILRNTRMPYRVIAYNDASPDTRVGEYLDTIAAEHPQFEVIHGERNLGFVGAVNTSIQHVRHHFVLLNEDTEVPPGWLDRLMQPILGDPGIASTTPFTNAGTICSFPIFLEDNMLFEDLDTESLDCFFRTVKPGFLPEVPTGVGFCMGVNKLVADRIGMFDAAVFGRGYGEENDWCMRARAAGFRNVMVTNLFVYHKHGGSFLSEEKQQLVNANLKKLFKLHPEYPGLVEDYIHRDPVKLVRDFVAIQAACRNGAVLLIDHDLGGGANLFRNHLMAEQLDHGEKFLLLRYDFAHAVYKLDFRDTQLTVPYHFSALWEMEEIFARLPIKEVLVSNLVSFLQPLEFTALLARLRKMHDFHLRVYVHDYFLVCPSYTLLDNSGHYCGVPDNLDTCRRCLAQHPGEFKMYVPDTALDIGRWRAGWQKLLHRADDIRCFCQASKAIVQRAHPLLDDSQFTVVPHQIKEIKALPYALRPGELRIGILGSINHQKGLQIIKQMLELIGVTKQSIHIIIIGITSEPLEHPALTITGAYTREELPGLIKTHAISVFFIPSIWPETFSYTSEEIMQLGLPLAVFDIGAPPERVIHYDKGLIIERIDAAHALGEIVRWARQLPQTPVKPSYLGEKCFTVRSLVEFAHGGETPAWPLEIFLEVSNICDMKCAMCVNFSELNENRFATLRSEDRGFLELDLEKLSPFLKHALSVHCFGYGEPTLHPRFKELITTLGHYECLIDFFTNGMHLTDEFCEFLVKNKVHRVTISFSGVTKEEYENVYLGGHYETVLAGVRRLATAKQRHNSRYPEIEINSLAFQHHIDKIVEFVDLMADNGVNIISVKSLNGYETVPQLHGHIAVMRPWVEGKLLEQAQDRARQRGLKLFDASPFINTASVERESDVESRRHSRIIGSANDAATVPIAQLQDIARHIKPVKTPARNRELIATSPKDLDICRPPEDIGVPCLEPFKTLYIKKNAAIKPCCFWVKPISPSLGNLNDTSSADDVWHGNGFSVIRQGILRGEYPMTLCATCLKLKLYPKYHGLDYIIAAYAQWRDSMFADKFPGSILEQAKHLGSNQEIIAAHDAVQQTIRKTPQSTDFNRHDAVL